MKLNIFKSMTEALAFSLRHAVPFYLLALLVGLPGYLHGFLPRETQRLTMPGGDYTEVLPRPWWETDLVLPAIQAVLLGVMVAVMVHTLRRDRRGEIRTVLPGLGDAAPCLPTAIAVSLVIEVASKTITGGSAFLGGLIGAGSQLLLFPAMALLFLLYLVFCMAIPCAAIDNAGVVKAFRCSAALTAGSRGRLFSLFVILLLPLFAAIMALAWFFRDTDFSGSLPALGLWLFSAAASVYFGSLIVVLHEALTALKEGAGAGALAPVLD